MLPIKQRFTHLIERLENYKTNSPIVTTSTTKLLTLIHAGNVKRISLGYSCFPKQRNPETKQFRKNASNYKVKNENLRKRELEAREVIDWMIRMGKPASLALFVEKFKTFNGRMSVYDFFDEIINELKAQEKISNAKKYLQTKKSLAKYRSSKSLQFSNIDFRFLKGWETYLFQNNCTDGGIHFYMRTLRALFNKAIQRNIVEQDLYPFNTQFNRKGYAFAHLKPTYKPRPLSIEAIERIKQFPINQYPKLKTAVQFFLFSYYTHGMAFVDMAFLTHKNIYDGRIHYTRKKTGKPMPSIKVTDNIASIIQEFSCSHYVLPIL